MSVLFTGSESDPEDLQGVIGQAIGAASMCWENMSGTGIFDSTRARQILDDALNWVTENYVPRHTDEVV